MSDVLPDEKVIYTRGQKVWRKGSGYGWRVRIPATVIEISASGKRVLVKFQTRDFFGQVNGGMSSYVSLSKLEPRDE